MPTRLLPRTTRDSFLILAAIAIALAASAARTKAEEPPRETMTATYRGLTRHVAWTGMPVLPVSFRYVYDGRDQWIGRLGQQPFVAAGMTPVVGGLNWGIPSYVPTPAGMERNFGTFCAEIPIAVIPGNTYRFEIQPLDDPDAYGLDANEANRVAAGRRAGYLRELYGRHYLATVGDPTATAAFQIAIWEIVHEAELPEEPEAPFDLFGGTFRSGTAVADAPAHERVAQDYLGSLTGSDAAFRENYELAGRDLVRLKGVPGALSGSAVGQSQISLRTLRGGGGGGGGAAGSGGSPGGGFAGIGPLGLGFASPLGGGGAVSGIGSGFGGFVPPLGARGNTAGPVLAGPVVAPHSSLPLPPIAAPGTPVTPIPVPPIDDRVDTEPIPNTPPGGVIETPTPPGLVLVLIGAGALAVRRGLQRAFRIA